MFSKATLLALAPLFAGLAHSSGFQVSLFTDGACKQGQYTTWVDNDTCHSGLPNPGAGSAMVIASANGCKPGQLQFFEDGDACVGNCVYGGDLGTDEFLLGECLPLGGKPWSVGLYVHKGVSMCCGWMGLIVRL